MTPPARRRPTAHGLTPQCAAGPGAHRTRAFTEALAPGADADPAGARGLAPAFGKGRGGGHPPAAEATAAPISRTRTRSTRTAEETHP
ncbi:hypothetical protein [Streptomyces sp. NPDC059708]|uniref:hypothetical protein n=1 Tax=Streptomyces sp. NPDC059708 TaxID=3346916 RepID=UPI0036CF1C22